MIVTVVAQNAEGKRLEIEVSAETDTAACDAVLRMLNSWRAISVLRAPLPKSNEPGVSVTVDFSGSHPQVVKSEVPIDPQKAQAEEAGGIELPPGQGSRAGGHGVRDARPLKPIRSTGVRDWIGMSPTTKLGAVGRALKEAA